MIPTSGSWYRIGGLHLPCSFVVSLFPLWKNEEEYGLFFPLTAVSPTLDAVYKTLLVKPYGLLRSQGSCSDHLCVITSHTCRFGIVN